MNVLLFSNQQMKLRAIDYIDDSNIENFKKAVFDLSEYEKFDLTLKICLSNARNLVKFCEYLSNPVEETKIDFIEEKAIEYKFGELITNFLSSYYNFTEYCKYNSKKWLGEESCEETKRILSEFYDLGYFYQFYPRFRNYITHFGLPFHISYTTINDNKKIRVFLVFPEVLLASKQSWGTEFKQELEQMSSNGQRMNLLDMFSVCDSHFATLAKDIHDYYIEKISNSVFLISNYLKGYDYNNYKFYLGFYDSTEKFEDYLDKIEKDEPLFQFENIYTSALIY